MGKQSSPTQPTSTIQQCMRCIYGKKASSESLIWRERFSLQSTRLTKRLKSGLYPDQLNNADFYQGHLQTLLGLVLELLCARTIKSTTATHPRIPGLSTTSSKMNWTSKASVRT
jgi:hypothetical protein